METCSCVLKKHSLDFYMYVQGLQRNQINMLCTLLSSIIYCTMVLFPLLLSILASLYICCQLSGHPYTCNTANDIIPGTECYQPLPFPRSVCIHTPVMTLWLYTQDNGYSSAEPTDPPPIPPHSPVKPHIKVRICSQTVCTGGVCVLVVSVCAGGVCVCAGGVYVCWWCLCVCWWCLCVGVCLRVLVVSVCWSCLCVLVCMLSTGVFLVIKKACQRMNIRRK